MTITLGILNSKGGVGKTTTALNLAAMLADGVLGEQYHVLFIDIDPQATGSKAVAATTFYDNADRSLAPALIVKDPRKHIPLERIICQSPWSPNLDYVPVETESLSAATSELLRLANSEVRLANLIRPVKAAYDFVIIDFLPSANEGNVLFSNGLAASDAVIIPTELTHFDLLTLPRTLRLIEEAEYAYGHAIHVLGILPTQARPNTLDHRTYLDQLTGSYGALVYPMNIPLSTDISGSFGRNLPLHQYATNGKPLQAYIEFGKETLRRAKKI